jgi:hypothetical protein
MSAVGDHTIADLEPIHGRSDVHHPTHIAIAEGKGLIELVEHGFECRK